MDAPANNLGRQSCRRLELAAGLVIEGSDEGFRQLLEHCSDEAIYAAQTCAVVLSLVNRSQSDRRLVCPPGFELYEPGELSALPALTPAKNSGHFSDQFVSAYRGLRQYLDAGRSLVPALLNQRSPAGYPDPQDLNELVSALHTAAVFCDLLLGELALLHGKVPDKATASQLTGVRSWLDRVRFGENICIRGSAIELPEIFLRPERAESQRVVVNLRATLICGEMIRDVNVRDLSLGGCAIEGALPLVRGAKAEVALPFGRRLFGEVRWSDGRSAGLKFFERLKADDPLFKSDGDETGAAAATNNGTVTPAKAALG